MLLPLDDVVHPIGGGDRQAAAAQALDRQPERGERPADLMGGDGQKLVASGQRALGAPEQPGILHRQGDAAAKLLDQCQLGGGEAVLRAPRRR